MPRPPRTASSVDNAGIWATRWARSAGTLSVYVLLPVPIVAVTVWLFGRQIHALYGKIQASLAVLSAKAQENLAGVRVVRAYGQEEAEIRGFDAPNREYINRNLRLTVTRLKADGQQPRSQRKPDDAHPRSPWQKPFLRSRGSATHCIYRAMGVTKRYFSDFCHRLAILQ